MLDAWSLLLDLLVALFPLVILKEPHKYIFSVHRSKHLKLICPSKRGNLYTDYPEEGPGMLHQLF